MKLERDNRLGVSFTNRLGLKGTCIKYNNSRDILVQFEDGFIKHTTWKSFKNGEFKHDYAPNNKGGIKGTKHPAAKDGKIYKEYDAWSGILRRCNVNDQKHPSYVDVNLCSEWLYYDNFYDWLISQENFNAWLTGYRTSVDKDILVKGNKIYSPDTCCLVPYNVNCLFTKTNSKRGEYPIGVYYRKDKKRFVAQCHNPERGMQDFCGNFDSPEEAFYEGYKPYKEQLIKKIATEEFEKGTINKKCYEAMMNYVVEITD